MGQPKGGSTQQTTQSTAYDPWISQAQQALAGMGLAQNLPFLNSSSYGHAGLNLDEQKGIDLARDMVGKYGPGSDNLGGSRDLVGQAMGMAGQGSRAQAAQLSPTDFQQFMNPYLQSVLTPATDELQRQTENARAGMAGRAAASGAYGGSRGAIQEGQLDRSMQETGSRLVADTMAQGFDKANALAEGNVDRTQQTNMQNANNSIAGANSLLSGAGTLENLLNSDFNRNRSVTGDLLDVGQFQQQDMQAILDLPYEALARLYGYIPQMYDSTGTTTQPNNSPSMLQNLLGLGLSIGGMKNDAGGSLLGNWLNKT